MQQFPGKLQKKMAERSNSNALRRLMLPKDMVDFSSNDYLGLAKDEGIFEGTHQLLKDRGLLMNGATGSRLLSGNHRLYGEVENMLCRQYDAEAALVFNSGYDANIGFFSSVPQRGDIILYDEYIHASIRDGMAMSLAKRYKFKHNDLEAIAALVERLRTEGDIYVITESVFSMDGDSPDLEKLSKYCDENSIYLVVDEAHAVGVYDNGLIPQMELAAGVFARIITFGKAFGCHGAAVLGSTLLKDYLVNFARSLVYTTGLPPHSLANILTAHQVFEGSKAAKKLTENINFFLQQLQQQGLDTQFIPSSSAIQSAVFSGNDQVKQLSVQLQEKGFDVKPILSPTVPAGQERLRFLFAQLQF